MRLELETVKKTLQSVKEKQQAEQKAAQSEIKALKDKIRDLSDNTKVGEKQQVIDQMVLEQQNSAALIKELHDELQTADVDRRCSKSATTSQNEFLLETISSAL